MFFYQNHRLNLYFGSQKDSISLQEIAQQKITQSLEAIQRQLHVSQGVILQQNHGTDGLHVQNDDDSSYYFSVVGDYIFTQRIECAIGVVTADCLPVVIYDPITHTAAVIHAGWKGLLADIFTTCLKNLMTATGAQIENITVYFGPAARPCCYEVQHDFIEAFGKTYRSSDFFIQKNNKICFDSRVFIANIARNLGIKDENIYTKYNVCTICNLSFCSYRRQKEKARRQITMICLR